MANTAHLIATPIIDKNGVVTTRMINPNKGLVASARTNLKLVQSSPPLLSKKGGESHEDFLLGGVKGESRKFDPRDYQQDATKSILKELARKDRCAVRAACGMGKTVIAQHTIAEYLKEKGKETGIFVFLTPSIDLTDQSAEAFASEGVLGEHHQRIVHSKSESSKRNKTTEDDIEELRQFLEVETDKPKIIFCTYQSYKKLVQAQKANEVLGVESSIDMAVLDEAHYLGGDYNFKPGQIDSDEDADVRHRGSVPRVFDNSIQNSLQVEKRVFLSATPDFEEEQFVPPAGSRTKPRSKSNLKTAAANEDSKRPRKGKVRIYFDSQEVFGKTVVNLGMPEAIKRKALVPIDIFQANLTAGVSASQLKITNGTLTTKVDVKGNASRSRTALTLNAWATASSTLESLATEDGHNALMFLSRNEEAQSCVSGWKEIALSMADNKYTASEARAVVDNPLSTPEDKRSGRLTLLAEYSEITSASSDDTDAERDRAFTFYDDKNKDGSEKRACRCGKIGGGWCACARVVSNVDLFGQGIDIKAIDTVTIGDISKTSDTKFTQAIGRAMRLKDGKTKGRLVIPSIKSKDGESLGSRLKSKTFNAVSRMMRDSLGATIENKSMSATSEVDFQVSFSDGSDSSTPEQMLRDDTLDIKKAAVIERGYLTIKNASNIVKMALPADGGSDVVNLTPAIDDEDPSVATRESLDQLRQRLLDNGYDIGGDESLRKAIDYFDKNNITDLIVEQASSRMIILDHKSRRYDTDSLNDEEILVAKMFGYLQKDANTIAPDWIKRDNSKTGFGRGSKLGFETIMKLESDLNEVTKKYHPVTNQRSALKASAGADFKDWSTIVPGVVFNWKTKHPKTGAIIQNKDGEVMQVLSTGRMTVKWADGTQGSVAVTPMSIGNFTVKS